MAVIRVSSDERWIVGFSIMMNPDHAPGVSCELTMRPGDHPGCTNNNRKASTPGLGDVLGVHELYPFTCPADPTADEAHDYQYVCPSIRIFYP